jgi:hypothetical protein
MQKPGLALLTLFLLFLAAGGAVAGEQKLPTCDSVGIKQVPGEFRQFSLVIPAGIEPSAFYDIGCAVKFRDKECASRQDAIDNNALVHDYLSGEQVKARDAFFAVGTGIRTPLGHGVVAFKEKTAAEQFAREHKGKVMKWHEVVNLVFK